MALSGYFLPIACAYVSVATLGDEDGAGCEAESLASRAWSVADCVPMASSSRPLATCPATMTASTVVTAAAAIPVNVRPLVPLTCAGTPVGGASSSVSEGTPTPVPGSQSVTES